MVEVDLVKKLPLLIIQISLIMPQKNSNKSGKKGKTWKSGDTQKKNDCDPEK